MLTATVCSPVVLALPSSVRGGAALIEGISQLMTITPLVAAAVPAGVAALKLAQHTIEQRPFRNLLSHLASPQGEEIAPPAEGEAELNSFLQLVKERLAAAGIDTPLSFEITSEADGNLRIRGNHPQQDEIEAVLRDDPEVIAAFGRLAATQQLAQAARRQLDFAEQYVNDPAGAASRLPQQDSEFTVVINGDEIEVA